jgi:hypothetical protein
MKNVLAGLLLLGVGVAVGRFEGGASPAEAVGAQGGGVASCAAKNGDVNGDGNVDLSDPVTILGNLFPRQPCRVGAAVLGARRRWAARYWADTVL